MPPPAAPGAKKVFPPPGYIPPAGGKTVAPPPGYIPPTESDEPPAKRAKGRFIINIYIYKRFSRI